MQSAANSREPDPAPFGGMRCYGSKGHKKREGADFERGNIHRRSFVRETLGGGGWQEEGIEESKNSKLSKVRVADGRKRDALRIIGTGLTEIFGSVIFDFPPRHRRPIEVRPPGGPLVTGRADFIENRRSHLAERLTW